MADEALLAGERFLEGVITLWRAVKPTELADIQATGVFRNLGSAEGKYFSTTAEGAASYAKQAFYGFKDPPYTLIRAEAPGSLLLQVDSRQWTGVSLR